MGGFRYAEGMSGIPHVTRSPSGIYKYRRVVPEPLRAVIRKREIKATLGRDFAEARREALRLDSETEQVFSRARAELEKTLGKDRESAGERGSEKSQDSAECKAGPGQGHPAERGYDEITLDDAERLATDWLKAEIRRHEEYIADGFYSPEVKVGSDVKSEAWGPFVPELDAIDELHISQLSEEEAEEFLRVMWTIENKPIVPLTYEAQMADTSRTETPVDFAIEDVIKGSGLNIEPNGRSWRFLRNAVLRAHKTFLKELNKRLSGDWEL